jgi:hypothetical protein
VNSLELLHILLRSLEAKPRVDLYLSRRGSVTEPEAMIEIEAIAFQPDKHG